MNFLLENSHLKVELASKGAELTSIFSPTTGIEYLWQAAPSVWGRHAPVLFPIVGKLKEDRFMFEGEGYSLPQHGFARDLDFRVIENSPNAIGFQLESTEKTKVSYPFDFVLKIAYRLSGGVLSVQYEVINSGDRTLPFSIGAHPAFNCPFRKDENFNDYYLEFEQPEFLQRHHLEAGLFSGKTTLLGRDVKELSLESDLFLEDALVFKGIKSERITLRSRRNPHFIIFEFKGYPYFGIWTKAGKEQFICLEPWHGLGDSTIHDWNISNKEGIVKLPGGGEFNCGFSIQVG